MNLASMLSIHYLFMFQTLVNPSLTDIINTSETTKSEAQTTLIMCEELRKLNKIDSIIPQPLLNVYVVQLF